MVRIGVLGLPEMYGTRSSFLQPLQPVGGNREPMVLVYEEQTDSSWLPLQE